MNLGKRLVILVPIVLTVVAFVLSMLVLFAGHKQGFMEDYGIVRLNTSMVGHNILDKSSDKDKGSDKKKGGGIIGDISGWLDDKKDDAKDKINDVTGHIADKLAKKIGIKEWYSLHVMNSCEGYYSPNSTAPGVGLNITNCTSSSPDNRFNLSEILDKELKAGPVKLNLASIKFPDSIQEKINDINNAVLGLFILFALGAGLAGVAFLSTLIALWRPDLRRIVLVNFILASLACLSLLIGSMIVTIAANNGVKFLNKVGNPIGLSATTGTKFYILTWIATGFMGVVTLFWFGQFCVVRRERKRRGFSEKRVKRDIDS